MTSEVGKPAMPNPPQRRRGLGRRGWGTSTTVILATVLLQGLTAVSGILTFRILGVEGRGIIALVIAVSLMTAQLTLAGGLPIALARTLAERRITMRDGLRGIVRRRGWLVAVPALIGGVLFFVLADRDSSEPFGLIAAFTGIAVAVTIISRLIIAGAQGEAKRLGLMAMLALIPQFLFTVTLAVAWIFSIDLGVIGVLLAFLIGSLLGLSVWGLALQPATGAEADRLDEKALWAEARASHISSVRPLDSIGLDRILVGSVIGTIALGFYSVATAVSTFCGSIANAVTVLVLPKVAQLNHDRPAQAQVIKQWVLFTVGISGLLVICLEIIADPLISIAFGEEAKPAINVARWMILADGLFAVRRVLISVLQGQGRGGLASKLELALTPLLVAAIVVAASVSTLTMTAASVALVALTSVVVMGLAVRHGMRLPPTEVPATIQ